jgi:hypothetical protein
MREMLHVGMFYQPLSQSLEVMQMVCLGMLKMTFQLDYSKKPLNTLLPSYPYVHLST